MTILVIILVACTGCNRSTQENKEKDTKDLQSRITGEKGCLPNSLKYTEDHSESFLNCTILALGTMAHPQYEEEILGVITQFENAGFIDNQIAFYELIGETYNMIGTEFTIMGYENLRFGRDLFYIYPGVIADQPISGQSYFYIDSGEIKDADSNPDDWETIKKTGEKLDESDPRIKELLREIDE